MAFRYAGFADEAGRTLEEQIDVTRRLAWDAIEVRLLEGTNFTDLTDEQFDAAWEKLQANRIHIASFGSQLANWARPITTDFEVDVAELRRAIPRMQEVGARIIRCMSYPNKELPVEEWKAEVFRRLKVLAKMAEDGGVILGHENCDGYGGLGPEQTLETLAAVDSPAFKLIFDTGNPGFHEGQEPAAFYEAVKDHVVHVHIKHSRLGPDEKPEACYPDEGGDAVRRILADLKARDYDGYLSIEPHIAAAVHAGKDVSDAKTAADIYVEYGQRLMAMVERL